MSSLKNPLRWLIVICSASALILFLALAAGKLGLFSIGDSGRSKEGKLRTNKADRSNVITAKVDDFGFTVSTDKKSYKKGEVVEIEFVVENESSSEKELSFGSAQQFDFSARSEEGREVWRWSYDKSFAMALASAGLKPGEKKSYRGVWDQKTSSEAQAQVSPGKYFIVAELVAAEFKDEQVEVLIEITD